MSTVDLDDRSQCQPEMKPWSSTTRWICAWCVLSQADRGICAVTDSSEAPQPDSFLSGIASGECSSRVHTPSFYSFLRLSYVTSFLPSTFDPRPPHPFWTGKMVVWRWELKEGGLTTKHFMVKAAGERHLHRSEPPDTEVKTSFSYRNTDTHSVLKAPDAAPLGTRLQITRCECSASYHYSHVRLPPTLDMLCRAE